MEFITSGINIMLSASMAAQRSNDSELAAINMEGILAMLPERYQRNIKQQIKERKPKVTDRHANTKHVFRESLDHGKIQWAYYAWLVSAVMGQVSLYAHEQRDAFMQA